MHRYLILLLLITGCSLKLNSKLLNNSEIPDDDAATELITANPRGLTGVLENPGMGFVDFHFHWACNFPPITFTPEQCAERIRKTHPANYPKSGTAYFRWHWKDLEPQEGQINYELIDKTIQSANLVGETLGIRVMVIQGMPQWLIDKVPGKMLGTIYWPDVRSPVFKAQHARLISALGARYNGHPAIDHVDIGTVGCWGEWNTACIPNAVGDIFGIYEPPTEADKNNIASAYKQLITDHLKAFDKTPVIMLGIGYQPGRLVDVMAHAMKGGAGWRVDCWGDFGYFGPGWSHQKDFYPALISSMTAAYPAFPDVWQKAPIHLEICGTIPEWYNKGWKTDKPDGIVHKSFQWSLERHASILNGKSTAVPISYVPAINELLVQNGYRFAVDSLSHEPEISRGGELTLKSVWSNLGTTPSYNKRRLSFRLRSGEVGHAFTSDADIRDWVPGSRTLEESYTVPVEVTPGEYDIEVALLDRDGIEPATKALPPLQLAIEGRRADGWYKLSSVRVR